MQLKIHQLIYLYCRRYSTITAAQEATKRSVAVPVRVRFAPSPTGHLHLGGLRTVVYNYLFARANHGSFILRIEDTDRKRLVNDSVPSLLDMLNWLGIMPNEGPSPLGGNFGPYLQSERVPLYKEQAQSLIDDDSAYMCFCSADRLMMLRNEALKNAEPVRYDSKCRHLNEREVQQKLEAGIPYVIRFKLQSKPSFFNDIVFGRYDYSNEHEGDFVILKSDGFPTYHFANVVDDHFMKISHVMRGEEWLISTPKHLELYNAFGWTPPAFAHLPLMLGLKGSKLSKRDKSAFVKDYKEAGYYPLALINSVCSTGKGFKDKDKKKLYDLDELVEKFDINLISRQSTQFEPLWLKDYNHQVINDRMSTASLIQELKELIRRKYNLSDASESLPDFLNVLDDGYVEKCINYAKNRIGYLGQMLENDLECLWTIPDATLSCYKRKSASNPEMADKILRSVKIFLENFDGDFSVSEISKRLKSHCQDNQYPFPFFMQILRAAVCGCNVGLPVAEAFELLGHNTVVERLAYVLRKIDEQSVKNSREEMQSAI